MKFKKFFILSVGLFFLIGSLNLLAFKNYWYWHWPWFDKPMHFLGGLLTGLVAIQLYVYFYKKTWRDISGLDIILVGLAGSLLVGVAWEFFEFSADRLQIARVELKTLDMVYGGWRGSLKDLLFDVIGSLTAIILFLISLLWQNKKAQ